LYIAFGFWLIAIGLELFIGKFHHKGKTLITYKACFINNQ
jgi:hypothetical protein